MDDDCRFVRAVREVVVACRHVIELLWIVHDDRAGVEVRRRRIELLAVVERVLVGLLVVAHARGQAGARVLLLVEVRQFLAERLVVSTQVGPDGVRPDPLRGLAPPELFGPIVAQRRDLDDVGAVRHLAPVARVAGRVGIAACPLEMDAFTFPNLELVGHKVVLDGRIDLDDVAAPAAHVQVVDHTVLANHLLRPGSDLEGM